LKNTKLILTKPEVTALRGKPLTDQWVIYKALEPPNLAQLKAATVVDEKRQAMRDAIDFYEKGSGKLVMVIQTQEKSSLDLMMVIQIGQAQKMS